MMHLIQDEHIKLNSSSSFQSMAISSIFGKIPLEYKTSIKFFQNNLSSGCAKGVVEKLLMNMVVTYNLLVHD